MRQLTTKDIMPHVLGDNEAVSIPVSRILKRHPGLTTMLMMECIIHVVGPESPIPTAATDSKNLWFNIDFMREKPHDEGVFVVGHEVLHVMNRHPQKMKHFASIGQGPDGKKWNVKKFNIAADLYDNSMLVDMKVGTMPADAVYDEAFTYTKFDTVDELYCALPDKYEDKFGDPGDGDGFMDVHVENDGTSGGKPASEKRIARAMEAAANAERAHGMQTGSGSNVFGKLLGRMVEPTLPWHEVLRPWVVAATGQDELTWARIDRRALLRRPHLIQPGLGSESTCAVAILGDISGSVSEQEGRTFLGHTTGIMRDAAPCAVHVFFCNTKITEEHEIQDLSDIEDIGWPRGGGTDMEAAFPHIQDVMSQYDEYIIICLTDGETRTSEANEPLGALAMVWCTTSNTSLAYGMVIKTDLSE